MSTHQERVFCILLNEGQLQVSLRQRARLQRLLTILGTGSGEGREDDTQVTMC